MVRLYHPDRSVGPGLVTVDDVNDNKPDNPATIPSSDTSPNSSPNVQTPSEPDNSQSNQPAQSKPTSTQISNTARPANTLIDVNDPNRWTYITKSGQRRRFSPKQIDVITKLLSGMPGNQAVMSTNGYNQNPRSAIVTASRLLATANQHGIIQREMELAGIGRSVQMGALSDVIHSRHITEDSQEYVDESGKVYRKVITRRKPTARDVVSAISTADRISGAREARKVQADAVSAELKSLFRKYSPAKALKDVTDSAQDCPVTPQGLAVAHTQEEGIAVQPDNAELDAQDAAVLGITVATQAQDSAPDTQSDIGKDTCEGPDGGGGK